MKYDLKEKRKELKITQLEVAEKFNLSDQSAVSYWERTETYPQKVKDWFDEVELTKMPNVLVTAEYLAQIASGIVEIKKKLEIK